jgi:hypothetical protein
LKQQYKEEEQGQLHKQGGDIYSSSIGILTPLLNLGHLTSSLEGGKFYGAANGDCK